MKISVIIPVYNVENYICECIDSVIAQTYKNFELILVDDGSSDNSGVLCDAYREKFSEQIVVLHKPNAGVLHARLHGIDQANGEILVFLDSDDCLRFDALQKIADCFKMHQCDMVLYDAGQCDQFASRSIKHRFLDNQSTAYLSQKMLLLKLLSDSIPNSVCLKAVRKECAVFPQYFVQLKQVKHGEDLLMSVYLMTHCKKIVYLAQELYHYRIRPGSAVHSYSPMRFESVKIVHNEISKCFDDCGQADLKPIHCTRKVKGCIDNLLLIYRHQNEISRSDFIKQLAGMSEDPYFLSAYDSMIREDMDLLYRIFADCIKKKQYLLFNVLLMAKKISGKIKSVMRSKHGG